MEKSVNKVNDTDNYYKRELDKLNFNSVYTNQIQLIDNSGNKTKWMSLNVECIDEVIYHLQLLREYEIKKNK